MVEPGTYRVEYTVKYFRRVEVLDEDAALGLSVPDTIQHVIEDEGVDCDWEEAQIENILDIQVGAE